ncbi:MAG: hypothetical protein ABIT01_03090 [Thermoanaerobaculia bacterium]
MVHRDDPSRGASVTVEILNSPAARAFRAEVEPDGFSLVHVSGGPFPAGQKACEAAALSGVGFGTTRRPLEDFTAVVRRIEGRLDTFDLPGVAVAASRAAWSALGWDEPLDGKEDERLWPPA